VIGNTLGYDGWFIPIYTDVVPLSCAPLSSFPKLIGLEVCWLVGSVDLGVLLLLISRSSGLPSSLAVDRAVGFRFIVESAAVLLGGCLLSDLKAWSPFETLRFIEWISAVDVGAFSGSLGECALYVLVSKLLDLVGFQSSVYELRGISDLMEQCGLLVS
jgi:hypothetical protein